MTESAARPWLRFLLAVASASIFVAAIATLHHLAAALHLRDVLGGFAAIGTWNVVAAIALTGGSYLALAFNERLALRFAGRRLPWSSTALTSFIAYAVGYNVGVVALSGAAVRYRMYGPMGLGAGDIAQVVAFCTLTFALGIAALAGMSLVVDAGVAGSLLHASGPFAAALGVLLLAGVVAWLGVCASGRAVLRWREWSLRLPRPPVTLAQLALSCLDLLPACGALYVLLPADANVSFPAFAGVYLIALSAGFLSAVPGGLGVFESLLVVLMPGVPAPQMLGVLLAYRLVYYVLPFGLAVLLLSGAELRRHRPRLEVALSWTRRSLDFVIPQVIALLVFGAGFVLLLSGATPGAATRLALLDRVLPLPVLELSHLAGSVVGVLLLILARGLMLRLDGAWHVTMWLLGAGALASLIKGLDYEEALALGAVLLPLWWTRRQFYRKASLLAEPLSPMWLASAAMAIGASVWVGLLAYRHVPYANELWWQFALDGHAPRMLRASLVGGLVLGAFAILQLMAPARARPARPTAADLERALPVIRKSAEATANLALLGDKALLFSDSGLAFLMYGVAHRSWVAMGDPVGAPEEHEELVWRFREITDRARAWSVFYQVSPLQLPLYVDAGLALSKLGEEARVPLPEFSLDGSARATLRQSHRKAGRDGLTFRVAPAGEVRAMLPALRAVSDEWLQTRSASEKGFSVGSFDEAYLERFPVALVEQGGRLVAFANVWATTGREELSIDLMRHSAAAPGTTMDYLFIELMLWGRAQDYRWFSLGMAPLSGLESHRLAPAWHRFGRLIYAYGENFYNFEGLRRYKDKFSPQWRPRYLAAPGGLAMPRVLVDVTSLISGGLAKTVLK